jgi:ATP synthase I chain
VEPHEATARRLDVITGGITAAGIALATFEWGWRMGLSFAVGAAIAWINYRWLRSGVAALTQAAGALGQTPVPKISKRILVKLVGRFILLLAALYVILSRSFLPADGVLAGLFVIVAAILVEMIYLLMRGAQAAGGA